MSANGWIDSASQDLRYAVRSLRGSPGFTAVALITLALGIAATTAIFSTVNAALLRPLPYVRSHELIDLHTRFLDGRVTSGLSSPAEINLLKNLPALVDGVGAYFARPFETSLMRDDGAPVSIGLTEVSEGFFDVLGLPMTRGRAFTHQEHVPAGRDAPFFLVISDAAWTRLFGRDPSIIGKTIRIAELPVSMTIVGVASPLLQLPPNVDFWFNGRTTPQQVNHNYNVVARLKPGATIAQVISAGNAAMRDLGKRVPSAEGRDWVIQPLLTAVVGDLRPVLLIALGATALLLALACVNVTNLLLARGVGRTREMALRTALGAGRSQIIRQLLIESMLLAAIGAILGFALAAAAVRLLLTLGASSLPRLEAVPIDGTVLLFGLFILTASGLLMGIMPALRLARADLRTLLNESTRNTSSGVTTSRTMSALAVAEIALAVMIVAGAAWLVQSFARLRAVDPGFASAGRLVVDVRPTQRFDNPQAASAWSDDLFSRIRAAVGDAPVGAANLFPLRGDNDGGLNVELSHEPPDPSRVRGGRMRFITPGYFEAMGIKLIGGRLLTDDDRSTSERVALVNRAFVRQFLPDRDPLTASFAYGYPTVDRKNMTRIVGVVDDVRFNSILENDVSTYYLPFTQSGFPILRPAIVVAATGDPTAMVAPLREALNRFDPQMVVKFTTAQSIVEATTRRQELGMTLMLVFGLMAMTLAGIGIYGVIAYSVAQRRTELATRIALGASSGAVLQMLLANGRNLAVAGLVVGLGAAYAVGRVVASSLYEMRAADPLVLLGSGALVAIVTMVATMIPAIRGSRVDPLRALRAD
ncbi:MAG: ABC transporter permease [Cyanobacteria bacterium]|nr:ABC transporter permease [Cyanobacteriota bacterium]